MFLLKNSCIFFLLFAIGCATTKSSSQYREYDEDFNTAVETVERAVGNVGLSVVNKESDGPSSVKITIAEMTNDFGIEPVQTLLMEVFVQRTEEGPVSVEIKGSQRSRNVMAGTQETAVSRYRSRIFAQIDDNLVRADS
jgi:hypothetical protein